jgi:hypothetical protein
MMSALLVRPAPIAGTLRRGPFHELRELSVVETETEVVLAGVVRSYFLKQMAQELARPALNGRRLRNRLIVVPDPGQ